MAQAPPARTCAGNYLRSDGVEWILHQYIPVNVPRVPFYFPAPIPTFTLIINGAYHFNCVSGNPTSGPYYETMSAGIEVYPFTRDGDDPFPFHENQGNDELGWGDITAKIGVNSVVVYTDPQKDGGRKASKTNGIYPQETRIVKIAGIGSGRDKDGGNRQGSGEILVPCTAPCVWRPPGSGTWEVCPKIIRQAALEPRGPWRRPRFRQPQG